MSRIRFRARSAMPAISAIRRMMPFCTAVLVLILPPALAAQDPTPRYEKATFAGGCFWCVEEAFDAVPGVVATISGYTGGRVPNPTYDQVAHGGTGHAEAVDVAYDPAVVTYERLLDVFWHNVDPLDAGGQFCDRGDSYRAVIFTRDEGQDRLAVESKRALDGRFNRPIATEVVSATTFYPAEEYHQNYYQRNPVRYRFYKWNCGRAQRLEELWGPKD